MAAARRFGEILAKEKVGLVYGGGSKGLMGAVASAVLEHGGHVTGIIPEFLKTKEKVQTAAQEVIVTPDMHVRKQTMFERADAFVALPGGIGTLEELVEQLTWAQLGRHAKPILMANIKGFWDPLLELIQHMQRVGFVHSPDQFRYLITERIEDIIPLLNKAARERNTEAADYQALRKM